MTHTDAGAMPLKTEEVEEPGFNLTPMVDVVFLLNIFFMVGTQIQDAEQQYSLQLPTVADAQPLTNMPDEIIVNVSSTGEVFVSGESKTLAELEQFLVGAQRNFPGQAVLVRGDGQGPYQHVMRIIEICHRAKIQNVSLANRIIEETAP